MKKEFISFAELGGWMCDNEENEVLVFDQEGNQHNDPRFVGFSMNGFACCDPATGVVVEQDLYNENAEKIDYQVAKEECEVEYYFNNPEDLKTI